MFLSKQEFLYLIALSSGVPLLLAGFVGFLLFRQNNFQKKKQIEIRDTMIATQDNERKRIAEDLHDHIGPVLTGIKLQLSFDKDNLNDFQDKNISNAKKELDEAIQELRVISHNLFSANIASIGLIGSLNEMIQKYSTEKEIEFKHSIDESRLQYQFKLNVYRICLELIQNSLKHSNGKKISLYLEEMNGKIMMTYTDNGKSQSISKDAGIGLTSIANRVKLLNGEVINFTETFTNGANYKFSFTI